MDLGALEVEVVGPHTGVDDDLHARPGDGHVEAPLTTLAVHRAEVHAELPRVVFAKADREEDGIALVALHVFEVLDEELFPTVLGEMMLDVRVLMPFPLEQVVDERTLLLIEGHDADRAWSFCGSESLHHVFDQRLGFDTVRARTAPVVDATLDEAEGHACFRRIIRLRGREGVPGGCRSSAGC